MIDDRTTHGDWPLPNSANRLFDDVGRIREAIELADAAVDALQAAIAAANASLAAHAAAPDPHSQYLTAAEGNAAYASLDAIDGAATTLKARKTLEADRLSITPALSEFLWSTDGGGLYLGDGSSTGGLLAKCDAIQFQGRSVGSAAPSTYDSMVWGGGSWAPGLANSSRLQGRSVGSAVPTQYDALMWDGSSWVPGLPSASRLQGRVVDSAAPNNRDILTWDATASKWTGKKVGGVKAHYMAEA